MKYQRIMLKLSGEGLMGYQSFGIDPSVMDSIADEIVGLHKAGVKVAITVGGGNIFRGVSGASAGMNRIEADHMGMLATIINAIAIRDVLVRKGVPSTVMSAVHMPTICEPFIQAKALNYYNKGNVLIFAAGTGNPFFTTDSGAALRASEMECDAILKATQVDGVYTADPKKDPSAKKYDVISYEEVLAKDLRVMDMAAVSIAKESNIPLIVFALKDKNAMLDVVNGKGSFTIVQGEK